MKLGWILGWTGLMLVTSTGSLFAAAQRSAADDALHQFKYLLLEARVKLPVGDWLFQHEFALPRGESPLRITYVQNAQCPQSPTIVAEVQHADTGLWETTNVIDDLDYYSGGPIKALRMHIGQHTYPLMTCTLQVHSEVGLVEVGPAANEKLIGALNFKGGFQNDVKLAVTTKAVVTQIRLAIPEYCKGLEVLELGTVSEGIYDKATYVKNSKYAFSINKGAGLRIGAIEAALNGPPALQCSIPVYLTLME